MKILLVNDKFPPERTTVGAITADLARSFQAQGHEVVVCTTHAQPKVVVSDEGGIRVYRMPRNRQSSLRFYRTLFNPVLHRQFRHVLGEVKPDIVLCHNLHEYLSFSLIPIARKAGAKVFVVAHDFMLYHYGKVSSTERISWFRQLRIQKFRFVPFRSAIIRWYLHSATRVIAVSQVLKSALQENGIRNVVVIHNGLDPARWISDFNEVRQFRETNDLVDKKVVFFAGRVSDAKGGSQAVRALALVVHRYPQAVLLIAGNRNAYAHALSGLADELGIGSQVRYTGWLDQKALASAYHAGDVVVFPSVYPDPFGMVNIEAMACSRPVIASYLSGASEIVQDGVTGYVVDPLQIEMFADRILDVLSDQDRAQQMGRAGYLRVQEHFTLRRQVEAYLRLFGAMEKEEVDSQAKTEDARSEV